MGRRRRDQWAGHPHPAIHLRWMDLDLLVGTAHDDDEEEAFSGRRDRFSHRLSRSNLPHPPSRRDYRGEETPYSWPDVNSHFGTVDLAGFEKARFYWYQVRLHHVPLPTAGAPHRRIIYDRLHADSPIPTPTPLPLSSHRLGSTSPPTRPSCTSSRTGTGTQRWSCPSGCTPTRPTWRCSSTASRRGARPWCSTGELVFRALCVVAPQQLVPLWHLQRSAQVESFVASDELSGP